MFSELLQHSEVNDLISLALREDEVNSDITTEICTAKQRKNVRATIVAKQKTIACGASLVDQILTLSNSAGLRLSKLAPEGAKLENKTPWLILEGSAADLLRLERTILNFLIRMCGIAFTTRSIVEKISHTQCKLLHTRKTAPGLRRIDVYSCLVGGAHAHRRSLGHYVLVKENHINAVGSFQDLIDGIQKYRKEKNDPNAFVEIEVRDFTELKYALMAKPNRIMLDNFKVADIKKAVDLFGGSVELEASGGITADNAVQYAETGVDYISLGAITHSAPAADLSMLFDYSV